MLSPSALVRTGCEPVDAKTQADKQTETRGWLGRAYAWIPQPGPQVSMQLRCSAVLTVAAALSLMPTLASAQQAHDPSVGEAELIDRNPQPALHAVLELACRGIKLLNPKTASWSYTPFWVIPDNEGDLAQGFCGPCILRGRTRGDTSGAWCTQVSMDTATCPLP